MTRARWIAIAPGLVAAQIAFAVVRHEACHALAARLGGARSVDVHLWPPRGFDLAWTTVLPAGPRAPAVVAWEAGLPHLVSLAMILATAWWLAGAPRLGFLGWNVVVAGAVLPWLDLALGVASYWFAPNDLFWIFGTGDLGVRLFLSSVVLLLGALVFAVIHANARGARARRNAPHG